MNVICTLLHLFHSCFMGSIDLFTEIADVESRVDMLILVVTNTSVAFLFQRKYGPDTNVASQLQEADMFSPSLVFIFL